MIRSRPLLAIALLAAMSIAWIPRATPGGTRKLPEDADKLDEVMIRHNLDLAATKLGRGVVNTVAGWLEIPATMERRYREDDTGTSIFVGAATGAVRAVMRTGVGVYETLTFWLPYPENFKPILPSMAYFIPKEPV